MGASFLGQMVLMVIEKPGDRVLRIRAVAVHPPDGVGQELQGTALGDCLVFKRRPVPPGTF